MEFPRVEFPRVCFRVEFPWEEFRRELRRDVVGRFDLEAAVRRHLAM
jgi:hypothetical protein